MLVKLTTPIISLKIIITPIIMEEEVIFRSQMVIKISTPSLLLLVSLFTFQTQLK